MAELNVVVPYRSVPLKVVFTSMCAVFPLWAVIVPAILGFLIGRAFAYPGVMPPHLVAVGCTALLTTMLSCLALSAVSENNRIHISKDGLCFPPSFLPRLGFKRNRNWSELQSANLVKDDGPYGGTLLLSFNSGEHLNLPLRNIKESDVEQLLLGVELWGANCNRSPELIEYQRSLQNETRGIGQKSYTQMWEDELSRRFAPTTFIPLEPGKVLQGGRIEVVRQLAFGGLSAIYLAHLNKTDLVVLKEAVVHAKADPAAKQQAEQHLEREAKMLSTLKHPNIARVLDHFVEDERHYLILEYISGQDLRQYVKQNEGQEVETVVDWAIDAATILAFLHANDPPVIHRDLTPDNLVVRNDGALILIDFGAANQFVGSATGTVVGKQAYIAPEQLRGKTVTQSDLYSLGGTIYYLLTGRDPMPLSISRPKTLRHDTPDALDELVAKLSAFEPEERVQAAAEVVDQLKIIKASLTGRDVVATGEVS